MKKLVTIIISFWYSLTIAHGNTDFIQAVLGKNMIVIGDGPYYASRLKTNFLFVSTQEMNRRYFGDSASFQLQINVHKYVFGDKIFAYKRKYSLGHYERFLEDFDNNNNPYRSSKRKCLVLDCISDEISTEDCLKLLYFGLKNSEYLQQLQRPLFAQDGHNLYANKLRKFYGWSYHNTVYGPIDFVKTIPASVIDSILNEDIPEVDTLLSYPFFRYWWNRDSIGSIEYYTKNDSIYFFKGNAPKLDPNKDIWNQLSKIRNNINSYEVLFAFNNISHFATDWNNNFVIFSDPTTMYHYTLNNKKLVGPIEVPIVPELAKHTNHIERIISKNDTLVLQMRTLLADYNLIYNTSSKTSTIDTSDSNTKEMLHRIQERNKTEKQDDSLEFQEFKREIFLTTDLPKRRQAIIILVCFVLVLSSFLALTKKL